MSTLRYRGYTYVAAERGRYASFCRHFRHRAEGNATWEDYGEVTEKGETFPLFSLVVPPKDPARAHWLYLIAGFHGEEPCGPMTLLKHWRTIVAYVQAKPHVGLRAYPCVNPLGFDRRRRYGQGNFRLTNVFIEYEIDGKWQTGRGPEEKATAVRWFADKRLPPTTRLFRRHIVKQPTPRAFLDIHQSDTIHKSTYAYVYGDRAPYRSIMEAASTYAKPLTKELIEELRDNKKLYTDEDGLISVHDASSHDYFNMRGVPLGATLETATDLPFPRAAAVNLTWIKGLIDLL